MANLDTPAIDLQHTVGVLAPVKGQDFVLTLDRVDILPPTAFSALAIRLPPSIAVVVTLAKAATPVRTTLLGDATARGAHAIPLTVAAILADIPERCAGRCRTIGVC